MSRRWRLLLLGVLLVGLYLAGRASGLTSLSPDRLRTLLGEAGPAGFALFVLAFSLGELLHVPGVVFVVVAVLGYGRLAGGLLGYLGALCSVSVSFAVVRGVGGQALASLERPLFRRLLQRLEERPVRAVALLRLIFFLAPPLNTALALSPVRFRHYLVGSAVGLVPAIGAVALLGDWLARRL